MVFFLLERGADQEHKTDEMHTALMEASMVCYIFTTYLNKGGLNSNIYAVLVKVRRIVASYKIYPAIKPL